MTWRMWFWKWVSDLAVRHFISAFPVSQKRQASVCLRKRRYPTKHECEASISNDSHHKKLKCYPCDICEGWHRAKADPKPTPPRLIKDLAGLPKERRLEIFERLIAQRLENLEKEKSQWITSPPIGT